MKMKQNQILILTMLLGGVLLFSRCGSNESTDHSTLQDGNHEISSAITEDESDNMDHSTDLTTTPDVSNIEDRTFQTLVTVYLDLNRALIASDAESAQSIATRILTSLANLDPENNLQSFKTEVKNILEASDISQQRIHFAPLSEQFYQLVKANQGQQITLYKQHCPMALEGKGAFWISDSKEIENPYYGAEMLTCGTVKETLAVNN